MNATCTASVIFSTAIGPCRIIYNKTELVEVNLDVREFEHSDDKAFPCYQKNHDLPEHVGHAMRQICCHLAGEPFSYGEIALDWLGVTAFQKKIYQALQAVPSGEVVTYKHLAALAGSPQASRSVGSAMRKNKFPLIVPCHRVVRSDGLGAYSAGGGQQLKRKLLRIEGSVYSGI